MIYAQGGICNFFIKTSILGIAREGKDLVPQAINKEIRWAYNEHIMQITKAIWLKNKSKSHKKIGVFGWNRKLQHGKK